MLNDTGRGTDGKSLYIFGGAGNVGTALIKIALAQGWEVISAADTPEKCEHLEHIGTTHVFDCTKQDQYEAVMGFTNGRGVDLVLPLICMKETVPQKFRLFRLCIFTELSPSLNYSYFRTQNPLIQILKVGIEKHNLEILKREMQIDNNMNGMQDTEMENDGRTETALGQFKGAI